MSCPVGRATPEPLSPPLTAGFDRAVALNPSIPLPLHH